MKNAIGVIICTALFMILIFPHLFGDGMFLDGLIYASLSRNMAEHFTGLWDLHYSQSLDDKFFGHLPLGIWLQSLYFKLFGDHLWVERIYALDIIALSGLVTYYIVNTIYPGRRNLALIVFGLWMTLPIVSWSLANNMLENTVQLMILISLYFQVRILWGKWNWIYAIFSGMFLGVAILAKSPASIFLLIFPLVYLIIFKKQWKVVIKLVLVNLLVVFSMFFLLWSLPEAQAFLRNYLQIQLQPNLNLEALSWERFKMLKCLVQNLAIPTIIVLLLMFLKKKKALIKEPDKNFIRLFFLVGLAGSLPIMLSTKQACIYLMPSLVFFALAYGLYIHLAIAENIQYLEKLLNKYKWIILVCSLMFGITGAFTFGQRDQVLRSRVQSIKLTQDQKVITTDSKLVCDDWLYRAYLQRHRRISLDCEY